MVQRPLSIWDVSLPTVVAGGFSIVGLPILFQWVQVDRVLGTALLGLAVLLFATSTLLITVSGTLGAEFQLEATKSDRRQWLVVGVTGIVSGVVLSWFVFPVQAVGLLVAYSVSLIIVSRLM